MPDRLNCAFITAWYGVPHERDDLVRRLCGKAVLMEHGRAVWVGEVNEGRPVSRVRQAAAHEAPALAAG
jgi:hypothetical protein